MKIPGSTYRIQFNPSFGFGKAREIVKYLSELGISSIYASPIFGAKKGSTHGYDVVDPNCLNYELGTEEDFNNLIKDVKSLNLDWIQDIVPNHMAYDSENLMLMDVFEKGRGSEFYNFFDIDWNHQNESLKGKVLAPFLGSTFVDCIVHREIKLKYDDHGFTFNYEDLVLPLKIESYTSVLSHIVTPLRTKLGEDHSDYIMFSKILDDIKTISKYKKKKNVASDHVSLVKMRLWDLYSSSSVVRELLNENIDMVNGRNEDPESFSLLKNLLSEQHFKLSYWEDANEEINYRRFFNINHLIAIKMEDEEVFDQTHKTILRLIREGKITGLRIDHIDGLYDPSKYLNVLRVKTESAYIVVEKILGHDENLPYNWPVQGTTGYDFLNFVNGLFCNRKNKRTFQRIYSSFTGFDIPYENLLREKKRLIITKHMEGDINNLAFLMKQIIDDNYYNYEIDLNDLRNALIEVLAQFPVYRTYISDDYFTDTDRNYIKRSVEEARSTTPKLSKGLNLVEAILLGEYKDYVRKKDKGNVMNFIKKFQQYTGPVMAKGFEDTVLYLYNKLLSLNEVGSNPDKFGTTLDEFSNFIRDRSRHYPHSMNATSTHDTKRGEDVRARINVLSELPEDWEKFIKASSRLNIDRKKILNDKIIPDQNEEYFLYQTLIGAFPFEKDELPEFIKRVKDYIIKSVREMKVHSSWITPEVKYEGALISFVENILNPSDDNGFLKEFVAFQTRVSKYGIFNSLSQTLLKITSPGIPDFYQGSELWDLNLVDPDNRRQVDFAKRCKDLDYIKKLEIISPDKLIDELLKSREDGRVKLFLIYKALQARNRNLELFNSGDYIPLEINGEYKEHVLSFARNIRSSWSISIVPRFLTPIIKEEDLPIGERVWTDTHIVLPVHSSNLWKDAITDRVVQSNSVLLIKDVLKLFPVALLFNQGIGEK
ncbi:malto-oligosyltrehalose synthase [Desulfobacterota bacterium AH_259_B03_O07]|nr:malto-oligosyltrehalose synthase [Desulfobacterota bacterium AH_259_B03_O07]